MKLPPSRRSATLTLQTLVAGRVLDSLTGGAPTAPARLRLLDLDEAAEHPLDLRQHADGGFAFYGHPERAFPLFGERDYRLQVEVTADGYEASASAEIVVGSAADQPAAAVRALPTEGIEDLALRLFSGGGLPRADLEIALDRTLVRLAGRVVELEDPSQGVDGATVRVTTGEEPATVTTSVVADAEGRFAFADPLPRVATASLEVEAGGFVTWEDADWELDYSRPVNELRIELRREPS